MAASRRPAKRDRVYRPREVREAGVRPAKSLGQHFLSDYGFVNRIVAAAELGPGDVVVEVGPGLGALTERLAEAAGRLIAVEVDGKLAGRLREKFSDAGKVTIVEADVLARDPAQALGQAGLDTETAYKVVGNLPYNIGAAVLRRFLESERPPASMVVMLQREVAESVVAAPGGLGLLGVSVQVYARAKRLFNVPPRAFYPPPKVTSSVIRLDVREQPLVTPGERERFFGVVRAGFSAPRKQLRNSLANGLRREAGEITAALESAGLDGSRRPQELAIEEWLRLAREIQVWS